jgi:hypothetical protein
MRLMIFERLQGGLSMNETDNRENLQCFVQESIGDIVDKTANMHFVFDEWTHSESFHILRHTFIRVAK